MAVLEPSAYSASHEDPEADSARHPLRHRLPLPPPPSASYKNKENINLDKVPNYKQHDSDAGSTQIQIARLSARIEQISTHLRVNRKDYSSKRGLEMVLSQRKRLLKYLYRTNRCAAALRLCVCVCVCVCVSICVSVCMCVCVCARACV